MRLASAEDFEQGGLYNNPPYRRYGYFSRRAADMKGRFPTGKILIAGCGWGYTVDELVKLGFDAWGCDASQYAIDKANAVLPATSAARILKADVTVLTQLDAVRTAAGLRSGTKFTAVVDEDMFTALTDAEIATAAPNLRATGTAVLHLLTCTKPDISWDMSRRDPGLTWKSLSEWKALLAPDIVVDVEAQPAVG